MKNSFLKYMVGLGLWATPLLLSQGAFAQSVLQAGGQVSPGDGAYAGFETVSGEMKGGAMGGIALLLERRKRKRR